MARTKSSAGLFGGLFGRKKKSRAKKKTSTLRKVVYMLIAVFGGGGGIAGASEYDWIRAAWHLLRDRLQQQPVTQPAAGPDTDTGAVHVYFTRPDQPPEQPADIAH